MKRNYSIDLLRVMSAIAVIVIHVVTAESASGIWPVPVLSCFTAFWYLRIIPSL